MIPMNPNEMDACHWALHQTNDYTSRAARAARILAKYIEKCEQAEPRPGAARLSTVFVDNSGQK